MNKPSGHRKALQSGAPPRGTSCQRGYGYRWQRYRLTFLAAHPLCVHCTCEGRVGLAEEVDHIIPHQGDQRLFWDQSNHQGLCSFHHKRKTAQESAF